MRYAGFWIRAVADILDSLVLSIVSWSMTAAILGLAFRALKPAATFGETFSPFFIQCFEIGLYLCASFPYYVWGHFRWGQTLGKWVMGVRVVKFDDPRSTLTLNQSMIRYLGFGVSALPMGGGYLMAAWHPQKRALHDLMAGSVSIRVTEGRASA